MTFDVGRWGRGTERYPVEYADICQTGPFDTEAPNAYETMRFGAPVARLTGVQWLTPGEVAARLHVCRATVYTFCDAGLLGHARVGLSIRIAEAQLEAFLAQRSSKWTSADVRRARVASRPGFRAVPLRP